MKAAGVSLNDSHLKQAIGYGANQGIEWVVLTNVVEWRLYRIKFGQPIDYEEVSSFNFAEVSARKEDDLNKMYLLCREGITADAMDAYHSHTQILNRYTVAQVLQSEAVVSAVRKELKKLFPDVKVDPASLLDIFNNEVLKREVIEGDKVKDEQAKLKKQYAKIAKQHEKLKVKAETVDVPPMGEGVAGLN